jgi:hypothetical protein
MPADTTESLLDALAATYEKAKAIISNHLKNIGRTA